MTGVTKLLNNGIFSGFNNLNDISLAPKYGGLLGYTEELNCYFDGYLKLAGSKLGLSREALLDNLRLNYDGFYFDERAETHVYCPWSVLNFCVAQIAVSKIIGTPVAQDLRF